MNLEMNDEWESFLYLNTGIKAAGNRKKTKRTAIELSLVRAWSLPPLATVSFTGYFIPDSCYRKTRR
jgi:hypothetical protein